MKIKWRMREEEGQGRVITTVTTMNSHWPIYGRKSLNGCRAKDDILRLLENLERKPTSRVRKESQLLE